MHISTNIKRKLMVSPLKTFGVYLTPFILTVKCEANLLSQVERVLITRHSRVMWSIHSEMLVKEVEFNAFNKTNSIYGGSSGGNPCTFFSDYMPTKVVYGLWDQCRRTLNEKRLFGQTIPLKYLHRDICNPRRPEECLLRRKSWKNILRLIIFGVEEWVRFFWHIGIFSAK